MSALSTQAVPRTWLAILIVVGLGSVLAVPPLIGSLAEPSTTWQVVYGPLCGFALFLLGDVLGLFALMHWLKRESADSFFVAGPLSSCA